MENNKLYPKPSAVLVVLPAFNEANFIEASLVSLFQPAEWMEQTTVVVADGGSTDGTGQIIERLAKRFPNLILFNNLNRLQSAGINSVVKEIARPEHRVLVRCDAHSIYPPNYVLDSVMSLENNNVASVVTPMDAVGETCFQRSAAWVVDTKLGSGGASHRGGRKSGFVDHGHHAAFSLEWFNRIGGYDAAFSHNEDAEYDLRLREAGGRIWLDADIRLDYSMRPTLAALARQYWNYGKGRAKTVLKHCVRPKPRQMIPVLNIVLLFVSAVFCFWSSIFLAWPIAYVSLLLIVSVWVAFQRRSLCGLLAGVALAAMHLAWGAGFLKTIAKGRAR